MVKTKRIRAVGCAAVAVLAMFGVAGTVQAGYVRQTKMFDVSQTTDPAWGQNWCAPTAVGNSMLWLSKEYKLDSLVKVNGSGGPLTPKDVINVLGTVDMGTDPNGGTDRSKVSGAIQSYIDRHGLAGKLKVESQVAKPLSNADGSFAGYQGTKVTKKWLKDQFDKGQDVEFASSYYEKRDGKWYRLGGHVEVYDGDAPGLDAGGHMFSMSGYSDSSGSDEDSDFYLSFTDPGRDDLAGQYGAILSDQYMLEDLWGNEVANTESTYRIIWDPNAFGPGFGALLLDGYQGAGDFASDGAARTRLTVLEAGWSESLVPEPGSLALAVVALGLALATRSSAISGSTPAAVPAPS